MHRSAAALADATGAADAAGDPYAESRQTTDGRVYTVSGGDWDAFAATHTPDVVCHDHRLLGWGTLHGADELTRTQQVLVELAPDTRATFNHVITLEHGGLMSVHTAVGTQVSRIDAGSPAPSPSVS